jgi:uncharacterized protein YprB with RNaseH-like and TPR domain
MPGGWLSDWHREGEFLYRRLVRFPGLAAAPWPAHAAGTARSGTAPAAEDLCFYDTETTGLSGGSGTLVFLLGTAWCEGKDLVAEQLFLSDFPGEEEFLQAASRRLSRHGPFVSYNGKAFDSRILATRFLMNRMSFEPGPQVDLLHHARRLWRSITGDCSLLSIERGILGVTRGPDVPGEQVPQAWFDFLRTGEPGLLPIVFEHNMTDVTSLARMYAAIGRLLGGELGAVPVDERALGKWMLSRGAASGVTLLQASFEAGNTEAGVELSLHCKRAGDWERAVLTWQTMLGSRSHFAGLELAKYLEHRQRDPARALHVVETIASWNLPLGAGARRDLSRRRERLARKLAGKPAGKPARRGVPRMRPGRRTTSRSS